MFNGENELIAILASEAFTKLGRSDSFKLVEVYAIISLLVKACIPFTLSYSPGTRRLAAAMDITININPSTVLKYTINLEAGGSVFGIGR